jgi:hypothetical protein
VALANALALEKENRKTNKHRERFADGDSVLEREFRMTGKMEPKWNGPRVLLRVNPGGLTAIVRRLYDETPHRVHLDDLRLYHKRNTDEQHFDPELFGDEDRAPIPTFYVERGAMSGALLLGQRGFDLRWP